MYVIRGNRSGGLKYPNINKETLKTASLVTHINNVPWGTTNWIVPEIPELYIKLGQRCPIDASLIKPVLHVHV